MKQLSRIVIAPDSFKGSLTSAQVIDIVSRRAREFFPGVQITGIQVADGGEGTVAALCDSRRVRLPATGPLGESLTAEYGVIGDTAVMEMTSASGLPLVPAALRDPRRTTSFGTGQMIRHALDSGFGKIVMGIGGSATNDGGMGALCALGVRFLDEHGSELEGRGENLGRVRAIDASALDARLASCELTIMCDVTNPLTGPHGATYIYGPQKGGSPEVLDELEAGMLSYERVLAEAFGIDTAAPGAGAAGGLGAAFLAVGGTLRRGIDAVLDLKDFSALLDGCDLVITGEGRFDSQSLGFGKVISGILTRAEAKGVPVAILAGSVLGDISELYRHNAGIVPCVDRPMPLEQALADAAPMLDAAAARLFALVRMH